MRRAHGRILVSLLSAGALALAPVRLVQAAEITGTVHLSDGDARYWLKRMSEWFHTGKADASPEEQLKALAEKFNGVVTITWDGSR